MIAFVAIFSLLLRDLLRASTGAQSLDTPRLHCSVSQKCPPQGSEVTVWDRIAHVHMMRSHISAVTVLSRQDDVWCNFWREEKLCIPSPKVNYPKLLAFLTSATFLIPQLQSTQSVHFKLVKKCNRNSPKYLFGIILRPHQVFEMGRALRRPDHFMPLTTACAKMRGGWSFFQPVDHKSSSEPT